MRQNEKHAKFAALIAAGVPPPLAYTQAGFTAVSPEAIRTGANRLLRRSSRSSAGIVDLSASLAPAAAAQFAEKLKEVTTDTIERRAYRIRELALLYCGLKEVMIARGSAVGAKSVPGGSTGLLAIRWKMVGKSKEREAELDRGLLQELRATQEQVARELGQWIERGESTQIKSLADIPDSLLRELLETPDGVQ